MLFSTDFFLSEHLQMGEKMMIYLIHNVILLELVKSIGSLHVTIQMASYSTSLFQSKNPKVSARKKNLVESITGVRH